MGADSLIAAMDEAAIREYVAATCPGTDVVIASQEGDAPEVAWGDTFFIYDPDATWRAPSASTLRCVPSFDQPKANGRDFMAK